MVRSCRLPVACLMAFAAAACSPSTPASTASPKDAPSGAGAAPAATPAPPRATEASDPRAFRRQVTARARQLCEARALAERRGSEEPWAYPTLDKVGDAEYELGFFVWEPKPGARNQPNQPRKMQHAKYRCRVTVVDAAKTPIALVLKDLRWDPAAPRPSGTKP